jgi:branched-chain amino acid aminotransferase
MLVFLNGEFVPEEKASVSIFDRAFLFGDGLFETLRVYAGKPFRWRQHWERLQQGADFLRIQIPFTNEEVTCFVHSLIRENQVAEGILRLTLSRGPGPRGYSIQGADRPALIMALTPMAPSIADRPSQWRIVTASNRLPAHDPLSQFKTCNKLPQILARTEAESRGADEALLLNTNGHAAEGAGSNLFWIEGQTLHTPPLDAGILPGITRQITCELCATQQIPVRQTLAAPGRLKNSDGLFFTLSTLEIVEAVSLDAEPLALSPMTNRLRHAYRETVARSI